MDAQLNSGTVFSKWLATYRCRRALRKATVGAYEKFGKRYPQYAAALFDEHFLANGAADLLGRYATSENPPTSVELASAWAEQIYMNQGKRKALVSELAPVASDFLFVFETELNGRDFVAEVVTHTTGLF